MSRTTIDLAGDCDLAGGELTGAVDVTAALRKADALCAHYGVQKVIMPSPAKLLVSFGVGDTLFGPSHARDWIGDPERTELVVAPGAPSDRALSVWDHDNFDDATLAFAINAQAARQRGGGSGDNLTGFRTHGIRLRGCNRPTVHMKVRNTRSITAAGPGSVFACQSLQGEGGDFYVVFDTDDGSTGSEAIVFQGKSGGAGWVLRSLRSQRMWRGMGCFSGHDGDVYDAIVNDLSGPGSIRGNAFNLEAGGGTGHITLHNPVSKNVDQHLVVNCNYGAIVDHVTVLGGTSTGDGAGIVLAGQAPAGAIDVQSWLCDSPRLAVVQGDNNTAQNLGFVDSHYRLGGSAKLLDGLTAHRDWQLAPVGPAFSIGQVTPNQLPRGSARQLRIDGTGFAVGCKAKVSGAGVTLVNVVRRSATQITATVKPSASAARGPRSLSVTNPDGHTASVAVTVT